MRTRAGEVELTDLLALTRDGAADGGGHLVRLVEGRRGRVRMRAEIAPRFDYGEVRPWIRREATDRHVAIGGNDALVIWSDTPTQTVAPAAAPWAPHRAAPRTPCRTAPRRDSPCRRWRSRRGEGQHAACHPPLATHLSPIGAVPAVAYSGSLGSMTSLRVTSSWPPVEVTMRSFFRALTGVSAQRRRHRARLAATASAKR